MGKSHFSGPVLGSDRSLGGLGHEADMGFVNACDRIQIYNDFDLPEDYVVTGATPVGWTETDIGVPAGDSIALNTGNLRFAGSININTGSSTRMLSGLFPLASQRATDPVVYSNCAARIRMNSANVASACVIAVGWSLVAGATLTAAGAVTGADGNMFRFVLDGVGGVTAFFVQRLAGADVVNTQIATFTTNNSGSMTGAPYQEVGLKWFVRPVLGTGGMEVFFNRRRVLQLTTIGGAISAGQFRAETVATAAIGVAGLDVDWVGGSYGRISTQ